MANKLMTAALRLELPDLALDVFEDSFGFYVDADPARGRGGSWVKFLIFYVIFFSFFCGCICCIVSVVVILYFLFIL
jgi:hypothetical protein